MGELSPIVLTTPHEIKWQDAPPSMGEGWQLAVLEGDISQAGSPYTLRTKTPDAFLVPPHWHPADEHLTVIEGVLVVGLGEKIDPTTERELPAGSYVVMPKGVRHYVWNKGETVVQMQGIGPFEVNFVDASSSLGQF